MPLDDPERRTRILNQARTELDIWRLRYQEILRLFNAMEPVERLLEFLAPAEPKREEAAKAA